MGTTDLAYALYTSDGAKPRGEILTTAYNPAAGTTGLALNTWSHIASTYDGKNQRFYLNGALVKSTTIAGSLPTTTNPLRIGGNIIRGEYFSGLIDEVRVYNRALGAAEIVTDMSAKVVP